MKKIILKINNLKKNYHTKKEEIKARLKEYDGQPIRVVTTQLIEAGVDIDIEDLTVKYFFKKKGSEIVSETTYLTVETGEVTDFKMNGSINTYIISVPFKELELDTEYTFEAMAFYKGKPKSGLYSDTVKYLTPTE